MSWNRTFVFAAAICIWLGRSSWRRSEPAVRLPIGRDMADWQAALDGLDGSEDEAPPVGANWYAALDGLAGSEDEGELVPAPGQNKTQPPTHPCYLQTPSPVKSIGPPLENPKCNQL